MLKKLNWGILSAFFLLGSMCSGVHGATKPNNEEKTNNSANKPKNQPESTALHIAVTRCNIDKVKSLLGSHSNTEDVDTKVYHLLDAVDRKGQTAVHIAVFLRRNKILAALLLQKPSLEIQDKTKASFTPLHWAAFYGYPEITKQLIAAGANVNSKVKNAQSIHKGKRPIDIAVQRGFLKVVELLIAAKADLKASDLDSMAPLAIACKKKYAYIKRALGRVLNPEEKENEEQAHHLPPTPCIYPRSYKMATPKKRQQFFADLGLKYMEENEFTISCLPLSNIALDKWNYDVDSTTKYGPYIKDHYVAPCSLKWVSDRVGYGFFAERDFKHGDYIIEFTGKIFESAHLSTKSWSWMYRYGSSIDNFPYRTCIDSTEGGNEARFINHSDKSHNVSVQKVFYANSWHQLYVASRTIKKGAQFLINYGTGYWSKKQHLKVEL